MESISPLGALPQEQALLTPQTPRQSSRKQLRPSRVLVALSPEEVPELGREEEYPPQEVEEYPPLPRAREPTWVPPGPGREEPLLRPPARPRPAGR